MRLFTTPSERELFPIFELSRLAIFGSGNMGAIVALVLSVAIAGVVIIYINLKE